MNAKKESFQRSWRETRAGPLPVCPSGEATNCGPAGDSAHRVWEVGSMAIDDVHRIASQAAGCCYSSRIIYDDKENHAKKL
jgi:hypothetical protein